MFATEVRYDESVVVIIGDAEEGEVTAALTSAFEQRLQEWSEAVESDDQLQMTEPQPASVFSRLKIELADEVGGCYRWVGSAFGGTGTEWRAEWRFEPGPGPSVSSLLIRATAPEGEAHEIWAPILAP
jgi:hypothetical protein